MAGIYKDRRCFGKRTNTFIPNEHQAYVRDYFINSKHKGLLLYHKLGSGKTCTSIIIADALLQSKKISKVYVITPGSLRENWISEYCRVCGDPSFSLDNFIFITYNYKVKEEVLKLDFNNSLVIVDEVHNLVNGVKNFSTNTYAIYYKIINSYCRVLALSGTPVFNKTLEFPILGNMLSNKFGWVLKNGGLRDVEADRGSWNVISWELRKRNPELIRQLLSGIISYYPGDNTAYPNVRYIEPIRCPMSEYQYFAYNETKEAERLRQIPPEIELKYSKPEEYKRKFIKYIIAIQWIATRAASNCLKTKEYSFIPDTYNDTARIYTMEQFKHILTGMESFSEEEADKEINNLKLRNGIFNDDPITFKYFMYDDNKKIKIYGWLSDEVLKTHSTNLLNISKKYSILLSNIVINSNHKHIVFSFYKTTRGTLLLYSLLKHCGIKAVLYSGDVPAARRQRMIDIFNHTSNNNGERIQVMLLTEAGGEGISLLGVNHVHIVESSIRENKNVQAIGRAVRYKSHINLPKDRQFVNVYRYWSVKSLGLLDFEEIDEMLYNRHFEKNIGTKVVLDEFLTLMENYSIEQIGAGESGGEMKDDWGEEKLEEIDIQLIVNINNKNHSITIPGSYSVEDTTNFLIFNYLLPPIREYVRIDLNITPEDSPAFEVDNINSIDINSETKMLEYIEGNLILYTYNISNINTVKTLKFVLSGTGKFTLKDLPVHISVPQLIQQFKSVLETFYKKQYDSIIIESITLFDDRRSPFTDETNLLLYFLNKKKILYEFTTSNPSI